MFGMMDAEFACIIYDGETREFIAARDPLGIRPLYYGYDKEGVVIFASEAKNLVGLADKIMPFPPVLTFLCCNGAYQRRIQTSRKQKTNLCVSYKTFLHTGQ